MSLSPDHHILSSCSSQKNKSSSLHQETRLLHDEERRNHLIDTACTLIQTQGYQHTTMDKIAHHAGMSKKTLYLFFPSKKALIEQMILERLFSPLNIQPMTNHSIDTQLFELVHKISEQLLDEKCLSFMRAIIGETTRSPTIAQIMTELFHLSGRKFSLQQWLLSQKEAGLLQFDNVQDTTDHLFGLTLGVPMLSQLTFCSPPRNEKQFLLFLKEGIRIFLDGCRPR